MTDWKDDVRADYEDLRSRFRKMRPEDLRDGSWLADLVRYVLSEYATNVDADYIRRKYPGAGAENQADKVIQLAAKAAAVAGGVSAAGVSALELSSIGPQAAITVPAALLLVTSDVAYTSKVQLRATYDLSVVHGAPLATDDIEDLMFVLLTALGAKAHEMGGDVAKVIGPKVVAYNVRKLLRSGLRKSLQVALQRVGGVWLARKLTERAMMRFFVPGVSVLIASGFNHWFVKRSLQAANVTMRQRGRVVSPVVKLYRLSPDLSQDFAIRALLVVLGSGGDVWPKEQLDVLRYTQMTLQLEDAAIGALERDLDAGLEPLLEDANLSDSAKHVLEDYLVLASACYPTDANDSAYAKQLVQVRGSGEAELKKRIADLRRRIS